METEGSLPCSQQPNIGPDPELLETLPHSTQFHQDPYNNILSAMPTSSGWFRPFRFYDQKFAFLVSAIRATYLVIYFFTLK
jgi:hypothetical protein